MIQDTVRTRYVICVYPTHGQDTRTTYLYKKEKKKANHHKKTFTKIFPLRYFFFFKYPSELVIATWMPSANHPPAASDPRMTTLALPRCRNHGHVCHLQAAAASTTFIFNLRHRVGPFRFLWQRSGRRARCRTWLRSLSFSITIKTTPKTKSCRFYSSGSSSDRHL